MSDPADATHPPGCECPEHPFVEPPGLGLGKLARQIERLVGSLSPAEQAFLRTRMEHADAPPEVRRAATLEAIARAKAGLGPRRGSGGQAAG